MKCNYHTHCTYCDGKEPIEAFVKRANEIELSHLGFSSHAPVPGENDFAIKEERIPEYTQEVHSFQEQSKTKLLVALECDFIPGMTKPFDHFRHNYKLDYIIGGVHLVRPENEDQLWFIDGSKREIYDDGLDRLFNHNVEKAVTRFWEQSFQMLEEEHFDIIAHMDKIKMHNQHRFFTEQEPWYIALVDHALDLIRKHNVIIEINTRGLYKKRCDNFYPSDYILSQARKMHLPFVVSSDAHKSEELNLYYQEALDKLKSFGIDQLVYYNHNNWHEYSI
jgi:histidinol-phosphatase (PHP family)